MQKSQEIALGVEKVLITGLDNAGKSSIQDILNYLPPEAIFRRTPSQDLEVFSKTFLKKKFVFFIPPGQERLRENELHGKMKTDYFNNVSTFIFVIDATDHTRLVEAQKELHSCLTDLLRCSSDCNQFLLFTHKQDLPDAWSGFKVAERVLEPLQKHFPEVIRKFRVFETTIINPETIYEAFLKVIAKHVGLNRINFDVLAAWVREQLKARIVLITDAQGLLVGDSQEGTEDLLVYSAYVAKIFSATDRFHSQLSNNEGIKVAILEGEEKKDYSIISRINCSKEDYLALFIGSPRVNLGLARIITKKGLEKLAEAYERYQ